MILENLKKLMAKIEKGLEKHEAEYTSRQGHWGFVGDLKHYAENLQDISDSLHHEGEYAD